MPGWRLVRQRGQENVGKGRKQLCCCQLQTHRCRSLFLSLLLRFPPHQCQSQAPDRGGQPHLLMKWRTQSLMEWLWLCPVPGLFNVLKIKWVFKASCHHVIIWSCQLFFQPGPSHLPLPELNNNIINTWIVLQQVSTETHGGKNKKEE